MTTPRWLVAVALVVVAACGGPSRQARTAQPPHHTQSTMSGMASWYGEAQMTASGERFDKHALTAAHRTLPLGTMVRVTNQKNGKSVIVRINDRGPYGHGRIIDLSEAAARQLDMIDAGVAPVTLEVIH
ncbi:MAG: septal ring lytic transglycosylase RlpA family protein [Deltaproteobacteria bacterium]|nr:septal ring lytic transglycosylase RlpA family protein [Deltaproteobacteria bacterium]